MFFFFVVWVGIGAVVGLIISAAAQPSAQAASPRTADIVAGMVIAGLLALAGIAFSLRSGARLVLSVSGAHPADPHQYAELAPHRRGAGDRRRPAQAGRLRHRRPLPQRLRHRHEPRPRRHHRHDGTAGDHEPRGARGSHRPRDEPHQELRRAPAAHRQHPHRHGRTPGQRGVALGVLRCGAGAGTRARSWSSCSPPGCSSGWSR